MLINKMPLNILISLLLPNYNILIYYNFFKRNTLDEIK